MLEVFLQVAIMHTQGNMQVIKCNIFFFDAEFMN